MNDDQKDIVRQGYDKLSHEYRSDDTPDAYGDYSAWVDLLTRLLPPSSPVLDLGCGCGLPATKLLAEHFDVLGVDFSEVQIGRARLLVPNARFQCRDIAKLSLPSESLAAVVSFYAVIHMPLEEHFELFRRIQSWLRPSGYFIATLGHEHWSGIEEEYLGVPGGRMAWSHADKSTNVRWLEDAGLHVHWTRFVPEDNSGHSLVLAQKPPVLKNVPYPSN